MARTSLKAAVIAGIFGATLMAVLFGNYLLASANYDLPSDFDNETLQAAINFAEVMESVENASASASNVTTDRTLFDVLGALKLNAISALRVTIASGEFVSSASGDMLGSAQLYVPIAIKIAVVVLITFTLIFVLLSRYFAGAEDENP